MDGILVFSLEQDHHGDTYIVNHLDHTLVVDPVLHHATLDGVSIILTDKPFRVLTEFAAEPYAYLTAGYLYPRIWGVDFALVNTRAVDFAVHRARQVLPHPDWLRNRRSLGWRLLPGNEHE